MRKCLYCGESKKLTKEHLWSKWVRRHLPLLQGRTSHAVSERVTGHIPRKGKLNRIGDPYSMTLKDLCFDCNNRLGQMQEGSKKSLLKLIDNKWALLDRREMELVAKWAVMFTMTCEGVHPPTMAVPLEHRKHFKETFEVPPYWHVFIAPTSSQFGWGVFNHFGWGAYRKSELESDAALSKTCNTQSTAFIVGRVFIMTYSTTVRELSVIPPAFISKFPLIKIWPVEKDAFKRPAAGINEWEASEAACFLAPAKMPKRQNWETL